MTLMTKKYCIIEAKNLTSLPDEFWWMDDLTDDIFYILIRMPLITSAIYFLFLLFSSLTSHANTACSLKIINLFVLRLIVFDRSIKINLIRLSRVNDNKRSIGLLIKWSFNLFQRNVLAKVSNRRNIKKNRGVLYIREVTPRTRPYIRIH